MDVICFVSFSNEYISFSSLPLVGEVNRSERSASAEKDK